MPATTAAHFSRIMCDQIGTGTLMAVGARDFGYSDTEDGRYLQFKVTGERGYTTAIKVTLDPSDTYTVQLIRTHKRTYDFEIVRTLELVYADSLAQVVRSFCGE